MEKVSKNHLYELDILRFIAAMAVLVYHFCFRGFAADNMTTVSYEFIGLWARYGYLGVHLFFVISGFVILMSVEGKTPKEFFMLRCLRLYPAFWFCCTLTFLIVYYWGAPHFTVSLKQYLINMTMLAEFFSVDSVDGAYWSLYVEINFYLLVLISLLTGGAKSLERHLFIWLLISLVSFFVPIGGSAATLLRLNYAPFFSAGCILYLVYKSGWTRWRLAGLIGSYALALAYSLREVVGIRNYYKTDFSDVVVVGCVTGIFLLCYAASSGRLNVKKSVFVSTMGSLTYPLYLIHQRIGFMLMNSLDDKIEKHVILLITLMSMLLLSYLIAQYIEKPSIRLWRSKMLRK